MLQDMCDIASSQVVSGLSKRSYLRLNLRHLLTFIEAVQITCG